MSPFLRDTDDTDVISPSLGLTKGVQKVPNSSQKTLLRVMMTLLWVIIEFTTDGLVYLCGKQSHETVELRLNPCSNNPNVMILTPPMGTCWGPDNSRQFPVNDVYTRWDRDGNVNGGRVIQILFRLNFA